jgi:hypothetical protein
MYDAVVSVHDRTRQCRRLIHAPRGTFTCDEVAVSNGTPDGFNAMIDKTQAPGNPLTTGRFRAGGRQCKPATAQEGSQPSGSLLVPQPGLRQRAHWLSDYAPILAIP